MCVVVPVGAGGAATGTTCCDCDCSQAYCTCTQRRAAAGAAHPTARPWMMPRATAAHDGRRAVEALGRPLQRAWNHQIKPRPAIIALYRALHNPRCGMAQLVAQPPVVPCLNNVAPSPPSPDERFFFLGGSDVVPSKSARSAKKGPPSARDSQCIVAAVRVRCGGRRRGPGGLVRLHDNMRPLVAIFAVALSPGGPRSDWLGVV